ncbi:MAG: family 16 glycosylhydrolase [Rhodothermales bacterium]|jgi:hypothetical protein
MNITKELSVSEGDDEKSLFVDVRLSKPSNQQVTAEVQTFEGTARAGSDFEAIDNQFLSFDPGVVSRDIRVAVLGDEDAEADETFTVVIRNPTGADLGDSSTSITLLNDDADTDVTIPDGGNTSPLSYPGMTLIWQDEFEGPSIDETFWNYEIGTGNNGWGNNESQYYLKENAWISDGHLVIQARNENYAGRDYTSTRMTTEGKFDFQFGRVDIRAALPEGQGIWPALWMLGANFSTIGWPFCGEIDIMEIVGHEPDRVHGTVHWANENNQHAQFGGSKKLSLGTFKQKFHVFSIIWDENSITWLLDDEPYHEINLNPSHLSEFRAPFFFIFNVAVGGNWPGYPDASTQFPQQMIVDYIRVFQPD